MRIGINTRVLLKGRMEGVARYIHETTRRMVLAHPGDEFVFFFDRPFHPSFIYAPNVTPVVLSPPTRDPILWKIWFDYILPRALRKHKIDVFLSGDTYMSLKTDVPTIIVSHDIAYHHFPEHLPKRVLKYYQKYFPAFHKKASKIITVSEFTKRDIIEAYGLNEDKISVAYNSAPEGFAPISPKEKEHIQRKYSNGRPFFMYVGSIHPRKNIGALIRAFHEFKKNDKEHVLILLGRKAWNFAEYEKMIEASSDIIWLDGNNVDPREVLPAATALAYVSLHEGFGIPILEGMSAGVPVITSAITSMPEVAGDAAILVDPHSVESIKEGFQQVLADDSSTLVAKGFERVKAFNWEKSASTIYENLLL